MSFFSPVKPQRDGTYRFRLDPHEARIVRDFCRDLRTRIEAEDAGVARLFPETYRDDPDASAEYAALVRDELVGGRLAAIDRVDRTLERDELDEDDAAAWCGVLNDLRLVLAERLDVTEETDVARRARRDPRYAVYAWLTYLQAAFVDALASRL